MNTQIRKKIADCLKEQYDVMNEDTYINIFNQKIIPLLMEDYYYTQQEEENN